MADLARLGFQVDTSSFEELNRAAQTSKDAVLSLGSAHVQAAGESAKLASEMENLTSATKQFIGDALKDKQVTEAMGEAHSKAAKNVKEHSDKQVEGWKKFKESAEGLNKVIENIEKVGSSAAKGMSGSGGLGSAVVGLASGMSGLIGTTGAVGVALGVAGYVVAKTVGAVVEALETLSDAQERVIKWQARLKQEFGSSVAAADALKDIAAYTREAGFGMANTVEQFSRLASAADPIGATRGEVMQLTETIQKLGVVSGSSVAETNSAIHTLGYTLTTGTVQARQLRSMMEQMPALAKALADGLGVSVNQLRMMTTSGDLTSQRVFQALLSQSQSVNKSFTEMPETAERAKTRMMNAFGEMAVALGNALDAEHLMQKLYNTITKGTDKITAWARGKTDQEILDEARRIDERVAVQNEKAGKTGLAGMTRPEQASAKFQSERDKQILAERDVIVRRQAEEAASRAANFVKESRDKIDAKIAQGVATSIEVDPVAQKLKHIERQREELNVGVAAINSRLLQLEPGSNEAKGLQAYLSKAAHGLKMLESQAAEAMRGPAGEFLLKVLGKEAAVSRNAGGAIDMAQQAAELARQGASRGLGGNAQTIMGYMVRDRIADIEKETGLMIRQNARQIELNAVTLDGAEAVRQMTVEQDFLDQVFRRLGSSADLSNDKLQRLKKTIQEASDLAKANRGYALTRSTNEDLSVIDAQMGVVSLGPAAQARAAMEARARIEEESTPGALRNRIRGDDATRRLDAMTALERARVETAQALARARAAGLPALERETELQIRIEESNRKFLPGQMTERLNAESEIRKQDAARREGEMNVQIRGLEMQAGLYEESLDTNRLIGREYYVQQAMIEKRNELIKAGLENEQGFAEAVRKAGENAARVYDTQSSAKRTRELASSFENIGDTVGNGVGDALKKGIDEGHFAWKDFASGIKKSINDIRDAWINAFVSEPIKRFINDLARSMDLGKSTVAQSAGGGGGWIGSLLGSLGGWMGLYGKDSGAAEFAAFQAADMATVSHSGGVIGVDSQPMRPVSIDWSKAPRFHSGGIAGGEMPAVLRRGEGVFTPAQMQALGGLNVTVVQHNNVDSRSDRGDFVRALEQQRVAIVAEVSDRMRRYDPRFARG